jgi:hypothetical protein
MHYMHATALKSGRPSYLAGVRNEHGPAERCRGGAAFLLFAAVESGDIVKDGQIIRLDEYYDTAALAGWFEPR